MKPEFFDVQLDSSRYLAGQQVCGSVILSAQQSLKLSRIFVRLNGELHTSWVNKTSDVIFDSQVPLLDDVADLTAYLSQVSDGELLPEGVHTINFQFQLPGHLPSSLINEYYGWIQYNCSAEVRVAQDSCLALLTGSHHFVCKKPFTIFPVVNLAQIPNLKAPYGQSDSVELIGCFRSQGRVSATFEVEQTGFLPGSNIKAIIKLFNNSRKKSKRPLTLTLCQRQQFRAENRYRMGIYDEKELIQAIDAVEVTVEELSGRKKELSKEAIVQVPQGAPPTSTAVNELLTITYFLRLDLEILELSIPIIVGSVDSAY